MELSRGLNDNLKNTYGLLENLLNWSTIQRNNHDLTPSKLNLHDEVNKMIKILYQNAEKKNIQLINKIDSQTKVNADINMLRSVFQNLITNGIKYTETDGVVTISASEREDVVEISITDNGIGMDSEQISNVFQFKNINSTDGTLGERGTGLGLILCKEFIEKNSGKIWFESELGKGTKFFFTLQKAV